MVLFIRLPYPSNTVLEPSLKTAALAKKKHKTTVQWTIQMLLQVLRYLYKVEKKHLWKFAGNQFDSEIDLRVLLVMIFLSLTGYF